MKKKATSSMGSMNDIDSKWRAEDDLRTLERAHEVIGDRSRLSAAKSQAARKRESLDRIKRLDGKKL